MSETLSEIGVFLKPNSKKIGLFLFLLGIITFALYLTLGTFTPWHVIGSGSMAPTLHRNDIVMVQKTSFDQIEAGDIVVHDMRGRETPTIMRVISKNSEDRTFTTKGDNNRIVAAWQKQLSPEQLKAKVIARVPYLGILERFYIGPLLRILLLYLVACGLFSWLED